MSEASAFAPPPPPPPPAPPPSQPVPVPDPVPVRATSVPVRAPSVSHVVAAQPNGSLAKSCVPAATPTSAAPAASIAPRTPAGSVPAAVTAAKAVPVSAPAVVRKSTSAVTVITVDDDDDDDGDSDAGSQRRRQPEWLRRSLEKDVPNLMPPPPPPAAVVAAAATSKPGAKRAASTSSGVSKKRPNSQVTTAAATPALAVTAAPASVAAASSAASVSPSKPVPAAAAAAAAAGAGYWCCSACPLATRNDDTVLRCTACDTLRDTKAMTIVPPVVLPPAKRKKLPYGGRRLSQVLGERADSGTADPNDDDPTAERKDRNERKASASASASASSSSATLMAELLATVPPTAAGASDISTTSNASNSNAVVVSVATPLEDNLVPDSDIRSDDTHATLLPIGPAENPTANGAGAGAAAGSARAGSGTVSGPIVIPSTASAARASSSKPGTADGGGLLASATTSVASAGSVNGGVGEAAARSWLPPLSGFNPQTPLSSRAQLLKSTQAGGRGSLRNVNRVDRFQLLQILVIFFIVPIMESLFWISLPLDYNTNTDQDPQSRIANFGVLCIFCATYYTISLYFGISASNYLARVWKNKHSAIVVIAGLSLVIFIYVLMYVGGAGNDDFIRASIVLPPLVVAFTIIHPFIRVLQLHIDPVQQARHLNTCKAVLGNALVAGIFWIFLQLLLRQFHAETTSQADRVGVVIVFALCFYVANGWTTMITNLYCSGTGTSVSWQVNALFRYVYNMMYYCYYRVLFYQVMSYGEFAVLQVVHLLTDIIPIVQVSERYVEFQNAVVRTVGQCCCVPLSIQQALMIHDIKKHKISLGQVWTFSSISRLYSVISLLIFTAFLRNIGQDLYYPAISDSTGDQYNRFMGYLGYMLLSEVLMGGAVVVMCRVLYGFNVLELGKYMYVGTDFRWILAFAACHFSNDPLWTLIQYRPVMAAPTTKRPGSAARKPGGGGGGGGGFDLASLLVDVDSIIAASGGASAGGAAAGAGAGAGDTKDSKKSEDGTTTTTVKSAAGGEINVMKFDDDGSGGLGDDLLIPDDNGIGVEPMDGDTLSAERLRELCDTDELHTVTTLSLRLHTELSSNVHELGVLCPGLLTLSLNDSYLTSVRDLGSRSLSKLSTLSLSRCGLTDVDGIESLSRTLTSLNVSRNHVSDVSPLSGCTKLRTLQLHNNDIADPSSVDFLAVLRSLQVLTLSNNPLVAAITKLQSAAAATTPPPPADAKSPAALIALRPYRRYVCDRCADSLIRLDGAAVDPIQDRTKPLATPPAAAAGSASDASRAASKGGGKTPSPNPDSKSTPGSSVPSSAASSTATQPPPASELDATTDATDDDGSDDRTPLAFKQSLAQSIAASGASTHMPNLPEDLRAAAGFSGSQQPVLFGGNAAVGSSGSGGGSRNGSAGGSRPGSAGSGGSGSRSPSANTNRPGTAGSRGLSRSGSASAFRPSTVLAIGATPVGLSGGGSTNAPATSLASPSARPSTASARPGTAGSRMARPGSASGARPGTASAAAEANSQAARENSSDLTFGGSGEALQGNVGRALRKRNKSAQQTAAPAGGVTAAAATPSAAVTPSKSNPTPAGAAVTTPVAVSQPQRPLSVNVPVRASSAGAVPASIAVSGPPIPVPSPVAAPSPAAATVSPHRKPIIKFSRPHSSSAVAGSGGVVEPQSPVAMLAAASAGGSGVSGPSPSNHTSSMRDRVLAKTAAPVAAATPVRLAGGPTEFTAATAASSAAATKPIASKPRVPLFTDAAVAATTPAAATASTTASSAASVAAAAPSSSPSVSPVPVPPTSASPVIRRTASPIRRSAAKAAAATAATTHPPAH